jgi:transcriptional regulator with XRE-family HTH domain
MREEISSKLALARREKGWTQSKVAEHVGVDVVTVCRWERGISRPYPRHVKKLCDLYGKTASELGLAPLEPGDVPSAPVVVKACPDVPSSEKSNPFARLFLPDIELRLQYLMYDWLHTKPSGLHAMLQHRLSQELEDYDSMANEQSRQNLDFDITRGVQHCVT